MWKKATKFGTDKWYIMDPPTYIGSGMSSIVYQVSKDDKGRDADYVMRLTGSEIDPDFHEIYSKYEQYGLVVPILDDWDTGTSSVTIFPKLDANIRDLRDWELSVEDWFIIGDAIVEVLDAIHKAGFIHPDPTPYNLMFKKVTEQTPKGIYINITKGLYRIYVIDVGGSQPFDNASENDIEEESTMVLDIFDAIDGGAIIDIVGREHPSWNIVKLFKAVSNCVRYTSKVYDISIDDTYHIIQKFFE